MDYIAFDDSEMVGLHCYGDLNLLLTEAEHELILDVINLARESMDFSLDYSKFEIPIQSAAIQKLTMLENLCERLQILWKERFQEI